MQLFLSDHNCEGQAEALFDLLEYNKDWLKLVPMELRWFRDVGLSERSSDETVWQFCQEHEYIFLIGNRSTKDGSKSLELTIRNLVTPSSLPVITVSHLRRIDSDPIFRRRCAIKLAEIVDDIEQCRGVTPLYIP